MPEEKVTYTEFAARLKKKYPEYKEVDDLELSEKMIAKYPEYKETVTFDIQEPVAPKKKESTPYSFGYATAGEALEATAKSPSVSKSTGAGVKLGKVGDTPIPQQELSGDVDPTIAKQVDEFRAGSKESDIKKELSRQIYDNTRFWRERDKLEAKERGYTNIKQYYEDRKPYLEANYLSDEERIEAQSFQKFKDAQKRGDEEQAKENLKTYLDAKSALRAKVNSQIAALDEQEEQEKMNAFSRHTPEDAASYEKRRQLIKNQLNPYYDPAGSLNQFVKENKTEISAVSKPSQTPKEQLEEWVNAQYSKVLDMEEKLGMNDQMGGLEQFGSDWMLRHQGKGEDADRLYEEKAKLKNAVKILALNRSPLDDETALSVGAKSYITSIAPNAKSKIQTDQQIAQNLKQINEEAFEGKSVYESQKQFAEESAKPYEPYSAKWFSEPIGGSAAFMTEFVPATLITEGAFGLTKLGKVLGLAEKYGKVKNIGAAQKYLNVIQNTKFGKGLIKSTAAGTKFGTSSEAVAQMFPSQEDEVNFATGFIGGSAGKGATEIIKGALPMFASLFGNKAPDAARAISALGDKLRYAGDFTTPAIGELVEETGETLTQMWQQSDSGQEFMDKVKMQFGDLDSATQFVVQTLVMAAGMGAGTALGKSMLDQGKSSYNNLNREQREKVDDVMDEVKKETDAANNAVADQIIKENPDIQSAELSNANKEAQAQKTEEVSTGTPDVEDTGVQDGQQVGLSEEVLREISGHEKRIAQNEKRLKEAQAEYDKLPKWKKALELTTLDSEIEALKSETEWSRGEIERLRSQESSQTLNKDNLNEVSGAKVKQGAVPLKEQLVKAGKIVLDKEGKVEDVKQNSGASSQLFKDLTEIVGDKSQAADIYLNLKEDEGDFKKNFADWENKIMRDYGRAGFEYSTDPEAVGEGENADKFAWYDDSKGKPTIHFNQNRLSRDIPFKEQKEGFIRDVIDPEIEEYRNAGNTEALAKMEEYKKLFIENINSNRDIKMHLIHDMMYGVMNEGKEITPEDIEKNQIRSVKEMARLNKVELAKDYFGEPMIYMHGGAKGITKFRKPGEQGYQQADGATGEEGIYFTRDLSELPKRKGFDKDGNPGKDQDIYYTFLKYKKPYYLEDKQAQAQLPMTREDVKTLTTEKRKQLEALGYDAIIMSPRDNPKQEIVVFRPDQVEIVGTYKEGWKGVPSIEKKTSPDQMTESNTDETKKTNTPEKTGLLTEEEQPEATAIKKEADESTAVLSDEVRANLDKIEEETGDNFRIVQNVYSKYGDGKSLEEITKEDYERAKEKRQNDKGKRRFSERFLENKNIRPEIRKAVAKDEDAMYYDKLPNDITEAEANEILDVFGVDGAVEALTNPETDLSTPVKNALGFAIINTLNKNGEYAKAADVALKIERYVATAGTEAAQALQSFKIWYRMHPAAAVVHAQKIVRQQAEEKAKSDKQFPKIKKKFNEINKKAAEEVVAKLEGKITQSAKITEAKDPEPPSYGATNRIVTKDKYKELLKKIRGSFHSGVNPEMVLIAAYHLEASGRQFGEFSKKMVRAVGTKVKPYLKSLYEKAKVELEKGGYDDFEAPEKVDAEFSAILKRPVKEGLKDLDVTLKQIIVDHYSVVDYTGRKLAEKLVEDAGLEGKEAQDLADAVQKEFSRIATEAKKSALKGMFKRKITERSVVSLEEDIIKMTNLGAFTDEELLAKYGEKMGWPKLTEENVKEIERLANEIQNSPDGFQKDEKIQDLLAYQANIKGIDWHELPMAIWYANMLSGVATQAKNVVANTVNGMSLMANAMLQSPRNVKDIASAYLTGIQRGLLEAGNTLKTGYSPIRGKAEVPSVLERKTFKGFGKIYNYHKYVRRVMVAADVISYEAAKEMRAYQLALKQALKDDSLTTRQQVKDKAAELVGARDFQQQEARMTAEIEIANRIERIREGSMSDKEKTAAIKRADADLKRRIFELIEANRPAELFEDSHSFAKKATYNAVPEGALGAVTNGINYVSTKAPIFKLIVPFTNIISNVANETINYTPLPLLRSGVGFAIGKPNEGGIFTKAKNFTEQDRIDLMTKAIMGTSLMTAAYIISGLGDDDDEPLIQITANGHGDFAKNESLKETGWQPYSVKIGDKWYSYQYTPLVLAFSYIGNIRDFEKYRGEKIDDKFWSKYGVAARWTSRTFLDATALSSLDSFLGAIMDGRDENAIERLGKSSVRTAKAFVMPAIFEQEFRRIEDWFNIPDKNTQGTEMGAILRNIPFARDAYFNKVNALGQESPPDSDIFISGQEERDSRATEIFSSIGKKGVTIAAPSFSKLKINDPKDNIDRKLTQEEFYDFCKKRGEIIMESFDVKAFEKLNKEGAQDYIKDLVEDAHEFTKKWLVSENRKQFEELNAFDTKYKAQQKAEEEPKELTENQKKYKELFKGVTEFDEKVQKMQKVKGQSKNWKRDMEDMWDAGVLTNEFMNKVEDYNEKNPDKKIEIE